MGCDAKRFFVAMLLSQLCEYAAASTFALPNCKERCGNVIVPYPFGIDIDCYQDKWFEIVCSNSSDQQEILFLPMIQRQVTSFNLGNYFSISIYNKFYIQSPLKHSGCPNGDGDSSSSLNLAGSPFFISENNKFTAVGCNNKASMNATGLQTVGCEATCGNETRSYKDANSSCVGYKCCQMTIPPDLQVFDATVEKREPSKEGCQVAFLTRFSLTPPELPEYSDYATMELEWRLDLSSMTSERLLCKSNTSIEDSYECSCRDGYEGNPYMPNGCQDIDECRNPHQHTCEKNKSVNVPGSFRCEKTWPAILGGTLSSGLLLLVIGMWFLCKANKKRKAANQKRKFFKRNGGLLLEQQTSFLQGSVNRTKLFNPSRILGQGGQGTVYKGMLEDGMIVAVKKSKALEEDNLEEFINEIILLSQINHRNVVKILGCCLETEVPVLVYEFIPNGSLFDHPQNPSEDFPMTWEVRLCIACEVADALSYLHSAASIPIYHRDVKSTNILLDEKHRAKVSDFGISRSVPIDDTHLTTIVQGTVGYVDPEYLQSSHFTGKSDVYTNLCWCIQFLGAYFVKAMKNGKLHEILDSRIKEECNQEEVLAVANLARRCLSLNSEHRPTMRDVFIELDRLQSKKKGTQSQTHNDEELVHIRIAMPESMSLIYSSPDIVVENSSFSLESEPLMPHKTQ